MRIGPNDSLRHRHHQIRRRRRRPRREVGRERGDDDRDDDDTALASLLQLQRRNSSGRGSAIKNNGRGPEGLKQTLLKAAEAWRRVRGAAAARARATLGIPPPSHIPPMPHLPRALS